MMTLTLLAYAVFLVFGFAALGLVLLNKTRQVAHRAAIDFIEIYARFTTAQNDNRRQQARLEAWQDYAHKRLTAGREVQ